MCTLLGSGCIYIYKGARSLVLWFELCGMTEMLPRAWDTRDGLKRLPSSQTSALH